jgi:hypothetical protein
VGITLVLVTILYAFRPPLPATPLYLNYYATGAGEEPVWGDGSDCTNSGPPPPPGSPPGTGQSQSCLELPAIDILFPNPPPVLLSQLLFVFWCNGSAYLTATLQQMEWVPGSSGTVGSGPQVTSCGSFTPPQTFWNRLAFFQQLNPGSPILQPGDQIVFYAHTFTTFVDDDFHGAPEWCYDSYGDCYVTIYYTGSPPSLAAVVELYGLATF